MFLRWRQNVQLEVALHLTDLKRGGYANFIFFKRIFINTGALFKACCCLFG